MYYCPIFVVPLPHTTALLLILFSACKMHFRTIIATATLATVVAAAPFTYPLANGFPKVNMTTLKVIFKLAGGTTPNVSPPATLTDSGVQTLQLIAANELFDIAYFTELLHNISLGVPGYRADQYIIDSLTAIVNVIFHRFHRDEVSDSRNSKNKSMRLPPMASFLTRTRKLSSLANMTSPSTTSKMQFFWPRPLPMLFLAFFLSPSRSFRATEETKTC